MIAILNWICDLIEGETEGAIVPKVGAVPPMGGVGIQQSSGNVQSEFFPRTRAVRETYVINSKSADQRSGLALLERIHEILTKRLGYDSTEDWQIATIRTLSEPDYLGQEDNEAYLYGSSIEVIYYDKKKATDARG